MVNGAGCFGCHQDGVKDLHDDVAATALFDPRVADRLRLLYSGESGRMEAIVEAARGRYRKALAEAVGPFLRPDDADEGLAWLDEQPEPITYVAAAFEERPLTLAAVASELQFPRREGCGRPKGCGRPSESGRCGGWDWGGCWSRTGRKRSAAATGRPARPGRPCSSWPRRWASRRCSACSGPARGGTADDGEANGAARGGPSRTGATKD